MNVEFVEEPILRLFALRPVTNVVPFFYIDEPFSRVEKYSS